MHGSVLGFFSYGALQNKEVAGKDVLEVGSADVNGSIRPMVEARMPASYLGIDIVEEPGVDRVLDCMELYGEFGCDAFDVVISAEMMEHAEDWKACLLNMVAVLRPGGVLVITTRSPGFAYHHPPDHWRYTQKIFAKVAEALKLEILNLCDDPEYAGVFVKLRKPEGWQTPTQTDPLEGIEALHIQEPVKVLGLPARPDGCGYYRFWQPFTQLQKQWGQMVVIPDPGQHQWNPNDDEVEAFDIVVRQRPAFRAGTRDWKRWFNLTKTVYETDDNLLRADPSGLPHLLDEDLQKTIRECLVTSHLVTVSTEALAQEVMQYNKNVVIIPDHIHEDLLKLKRPKRDKITICWAGGASHLQDLLMIQDPMREVFSSNPDVDMHFLGMDYSPIFRKSCQYTSWKENIWDYYKEIDGDIGIAPLEDTIFNQSRAHIKALEYAALGIPTVASDVEPYRGFVVDGETGFLVRSQEEWQKRINDLINDEAMRSEMGERAKRVASGWTIQKGWKKWAKAYEEIVKRKTIHW